MCREILQLQKTITRKSKEKNFLNILLNLRELRKLFVVKKSIHFYTLLRRLYRYIPSQK